MQIFLSVLAGLLWGGLCGLVNMLLTKKMASGSAQQISSLGVIRTAASQLTDPALRGEAQRLVAENQKLFTSFYNLV